MKLSKQEQRLITQQGKLLQQAQTSALRQWEMALKEDPRSFTLVSDDVPSAGQAPQAPQAVANATEQPPLDNMAASGA
jgi:hypothetical protein